MTSRRRWRARVSTVSGAQVADVATIAPGPWLWLILVDRTADGIPNAEYADYVLTVIE